MIVTLSIFSCSGLDIHFILAFPWAYFHAAADNRTLEHNKPMDWLYRVTWDKKVIIPILQVKVSLGLSCLCKYVEIHREIAFTCCPKPVN